MTLSLLSVLSLAAILMALAALPSASVALVVSRAATAGLRQGAWVALGIVAGDLLFVGLALLGLLALADLLGETFLWIKLLGGAYLIGQGSQLLLRPPMRPSMHDSQRPPLHPDKPGEHAASQTADTPTTHTTAPASAVVSFGAGLLLTLGDIKAILFYASLFPAFVDVPALTGADMAVIALLTVVTVGGVKLGYAWLASRAVEWGQGSGGVVRKLVGGMAVGAGVVVIGRSV